MVQKWGILRNPVKISVKNFNVMVTLIAFLHNFCINARLSQGDHEEYTTSSLNGIDCEFSIQRNYDSHIQYQNILTHYIPCYSDNRRRMTQNAAARDDLQGCPAPKID